MERKCKECGRILTKGSSIVKFKWRGVEVRTLKGTDLCSEHAVKECQERLSQLVDNRYFEIGLGHVFINWKSLVNIYKQSDETIINSIIEGLNELMIFSFTPENGWAIVEWNGTILNPKYKGDFMYFVRKKDVIDYARVKLKNYRHRWGVENIKTYIGDSEVLGV